MQSSHHLRISSIMNAHAVSPRLDVSAAFPIFDNQNIDNQGNWALSAEFKLPPISHIMNDLSKDGQDTEVEIEEDTSTPIERAKVVINNNPTLWAAIAHLIKKNASVNTSKKDITKLSKPKRKGSFKIHDNALITLKEKSRKTSGCSSDGESTTVEYEQTTVQYKTQATPEDISGATQPTKLMSKYRIDGMLECKQKQQNTTPRKVPEWKKHVQHFSLKKLV
ncbi:divalent metal cation transporter [Acrasis kona]|uniref:Divalent metal cation transporter n=1 Tax=Acrasis kona TaxID=1008807 RepID=A0AAW2YZP6_9EUKA